MTGPEVVTQLWLTSHITSEHGRQGYLHWVGMNNYGAIGTYDLANQNEHLAELELD